MQRVHSHIYFLNIAIFFGLIPDQTKAAHTDLRGQSFLPLKTHFTAINKVILIVFLLRTEKEIQNTDTS